MTDRSLHDLSEDELIDLLTELERIKENAEETLLRRLKMPAAAVKRSSGESPPEFHPEFHLFSKICSPSH